MCACIRYMYCVHLREGGRGEREGGEGKRERERGGRKGEGRGCLTIPAVCEAVDAVAVSL